ncbi:MAG: TatD family hydrolase [Vibrio sp.]
MFVDSHCHLDKLDYDKVHTDVADVLAKAKQVGVEKLLTVGVTLEAFPAMMELIEHHPSIVASCGVHPLDVESEFSQQQLLDYASNSRVVAIGETGLDYFYQPETKDRQQELFAEHVDAAVRLNKPLIIHTREARADTLAILRDGGAQACGGVIHCFTEDMAFAEAAMDLGFYISISGIVTFKQATQLQAVVKDLPLERLLIETDSPFLAPVPHRGKENQPAYVAQVAQFIADLKQTNIETIAKQTTQNFHDLFLKAS